MGYMGYMGESTMYSEYIYSTLELFYSPLELLDELLLEDLLIEKNNIEEQRFNWMKEGF
jgi:hypothetical protein